MSQLGTKEHYDLMVAFEREYSGRMDMSDAQPPTTIYLQWDPTGTETTWCEDQISDEDVEYIRVNALPNVAKIRHDLIEDIAEMVEVYDADLVGLAQRIRALGDQP